MCSVSGCPRTSGRGRGSSCRPDATVAGRSPSRHLSGRRSWSSVVTGPSPTTQRRGKDAHRRCLDRTAHVPSITVRTDAQGQVEGGLPCERSGHPVELDPQPTREPRECSGSKSQVEVQLPGARRIEPRCGGRGKDPLGHDLVRQLPEAVRGRDRGEATPAFLELVHQLDVQRRRRIDTSTVPGGTDTQPSRSVVARHLRSCTARAIGGVIAAPRLW